MAHDIAEIRRQALQGDQDTKLIISKAQTGQKLIEIVKKKRKQLRDVVEATKSTLQSASAEADRIIGEAKIKASVLISQAISDKNKATSLLDKAKRTNEKSSELVKFLEQKEKDVNGKQEKVDNKEIVVIQKEKDVDEMFKHASKRKKEVVDIFETSVALLQIVIENIEQFQKLNSEGVITVGDTFEKSVRILRIASDSLQRAQAGEDYNKKISKKNEIERLRLKDKEDTIKRTTERLKVRGIVI